MNNILYIIPDLAKVSGGPKTRVSLFKNIFLNPYLRTNPLPARRNH